MVESDERARMHDEENREEFAIRREEANLAAEERELERKMKVFEDDEAEAKRQIEAEWRKEHWGRDPERPPAWEAHPDGAGE